MTIKEIRKEMRELKGREVIIVDGWGQIKKIGKEYAIGPLSEEDDSDPYTDYDAWSYGLKESWVLDYIKKYLGIV